MTKHELLDILLACRGEATTGAAAADVAAEEADADGPRLLIASEASTAAMACRRIHRLLGRIPIVLEFSEEA